MSNISMAIPPSLINDSQQQTLISCPQNNSSPSPTPRLHARKVTKLVLQLGSHSEGDIH